MGEIYRDFTVFVSGLSYRKSDLAMTSQALGVVNFSMLYIHRCYRILWPRILMTSSTVLAPRPPLRWPTNPTIGLPPQLVIHPKVASRAVFNIAELVFRGRYSGIDPQLIALRSGCTGNSQPIRR